MMTILVIDGQGGNIGKQLVKLIRERLPDARILAVGTNSIATSSMIKAGADNAATGENSVVVCSRSADIITGPVGIVIADSLMGEVTAAMAAAVGSSPAQKVLVPFNKCGTVIAGVGEKTASALIEDAVRHIERVASGE